ncbi:MAG: MTAP family purine nucleoside phosphorylase [Candidatus Altiarchaeota archaeon]|nr:MTAP family purine nucleoside phosphorylase [Candidatus Altiarchaeota archaeon]
MKVGIIGGSNLRSTSLVKGADKRSVTTPYGDVEAYYSDNRIFILRHGSDVSLPPHKINHLANICALKEAKAVAVVGLCMVGGLKSRLRPPCLLVPDDYNSLWDVPTFYDDRVVHITPSLDENLRKLIIAAAKNKELPVHTKGVYIQTHGPRLETRAEVRMLARFGDVVGMTMASEATLAQESEIPYAALCSVDNYAHGIAKSKPNFRAILSDSERIGEMIAGIAVKAAGEWK